MKPFQQNSEAKIAHSINGLVKAGIGGRTFLYGEIGSGRLLATKAGRKTIILETDLQDYLKSLPKIAVAAE